MSETSHTILVVDDEADLREYVGSLLTDAGYRVREAGGGNAALEILKKETIDLVVSDVVMPEGDGLALLDRIREFDRESPPVILMSGFARISVAEAYERGAEALFPKPFKPDALLEAVHRALMPKTERWRVKGERLAPSSTKLALNVSVSDLLTAAYSATILNIGRGGMFLAWGLDMPKIGEEVKFEISFLNEPDKKFEGMGIVRWIRNERDSDNRLPGFGIEFTRLADDQAINILEVLNYLKTREFIPRS